MRHALAVSDNCMYCGSRVSAKVRTHASGATVREHGCPLRTAVKGGLSKRTNSLLRDLRKYPQILPAFTHLQLRAILSCSVGDAA
jgi:DNA-directed RNA polymerase subunit RPC12/RpoP